MACSGDKKSFESKTNPTSEAVAPVIVIVVPLLAIIVAEVVVTFEAVITSTIVVQPEKV